MCSWRWTTSQLYIVDPKSGEGLDLLEYVPPDRPIRYLGYLICANLDWKPALGRGPCQSWTSYRVTHGEANGSAS
jgi:hypothetical protein